MRSTTAGSGDWRPTLGGAASSPSAFSRSSVPLWIFPMGAPVAELAALSESTRTRSCETLFGGNVAEEKRHEPAQTGTNQKMLRFQERFPSGPHLAGDGIKETWSHHAGLSKPPERPVCRPNLGRKVGQSDVATLQVIFQPPGSNRTRNAGRQ